MKAPSKNMKLIRVERVTKGYDKQNRIVEEQWEHWYPEDSKQNVIGFRERNRKS